MLKKWRKWNYKIFSSRHDELKEEEKKKELSYQDNHEQLIKDENEKKEKLENEVTKIKEKLENYLSQINNQLKKNEKICKGIKSLKKEESNIIKIISYFSTVKIKNHLINYLNHI